MFESLPIFAVCGYSGSGKTTLLERAVPRFARCGMHIAVVKHDVHGISSDAKGKDSDRLLRSGADVVVHGPKESLERRNHHDSLPFQAELERLAQRYDLVLLEGFKRLPCRKVWLLKDGETTPPEEIGLVEGALAWDTDRVSVLKVLLDRLLEETCHNKPVFGCVLIGGQSTRMGRAKHLLPQADTPEQTWLHRTVAVLKRNCELVLLVGNGTVPANLQDLPRLADPPGLKGPMAGLVAAMRWAPKASWLLAACDMPCLSDEAIQWLLSQRQPFAWGVLPQLVETGRVEPLLAWYDSRCLPVIEAIAASQCPAPRKLEQHPRVRVTTIPAGIAEAWRDADTPEAAEHFTTVLTT